MIISKYKIGGVALKYKENESTILYHVNPVKKTIEDILRDDLDFSGRLFRDLYKNNRILLNGHKVNRKKIVDKKGIITILMEEEKHFYTPENLPLDIIYEDYDLIILNKKPGIVVHPTKSHDNGTIANAVAHYFEDKNINKKIRFVNRLDMDTSGILVVAKNPFGHQQMSKQMEEGKVNKKYLVLVEGRIDNFEGEINKPIGRDETNPIINVVTDCGKPSFTKYTAVERHSKGSLLEVDILTGRTHQIRVHMKYLGHPVIGDTLYNEPSDIINRQALHSYSLEFNVPRTGKGIKVTAELPDDMKKALEVLKKSSLVL